MFAHFNSSLNIQPPFPPSSPPRTFCPRAEGVKPGAGDGGARSLCVQTQAAVCICLPTVRARLCAGSAGHRLLPKSARPPPLPEGRSPPSLPPSLPGRFEEKGFNFMRLSVITFRSPTLTRTDCLSQKGEDEAANGPGSARAALTGGQNAGLVLRSLSDGAGKQQQRREAAALPVPGMLFRLLSCTTNADF